MLEITSDVPFPKSVGAKSAVADTLAAMNIGDSFAVPVGTYLIAVYAAAKDAGIKVACRGSHGYTRAQETTRCWRTR